MKDQVKNWNANELKHGVHYWIEERGYRLTVNDWRGRVSWYVNNPVGDVIKYQKECESVESAMGAAQVWLEEYRLSIPRLKRP